MILIHLLNGKSMKNFFTLKKTISAIKLFLQFYLLLGLIGLNTLSAKEHFGTIKSLHSDTLLTTISFGSCADAYKPQPLWTEIEKSKPNVFLFLGDNVYADQMDGKHIPLANNESFKSAYHALDNQPQFSTFRKHIPILATWDDHDYGLNDGGSNNPNISLAKNYFLNFFGGSNYPNSSKHAGVYSAHLFGHKGKRVQIILLDTRTFRSKLTKAQPGNTQGYQRYRPSLDAHQQMLGEKQWIWLEKQLKKPAEIRIIASSIQLLAENHGYERWGNLPQQRTKFYQLLTSTQANGVIIISGDRHQGGIYHKVGKTPYPIYEITASSINKAIAHPTPEMDETQLGRLIREPNFGLIKINWQKQQLSIGVTTQGRSLDRAITFPLKDLTINKPDPNL